MEKARQPSGVRTFSNQVLQSFKLNLEHCKVKFCPTVSDNIYFKVVIPLEEYVVLPEVNDEHWNVICGGFYWNIACLVIILDMPADDGYNKKPAAKTEKHFI